MAFATIHVMAASSRNSSLLSKVSAGSRPPFEPFYLYILAAFIGFCGSSLTIMSYRPDMLPTEAPPAKKQRLSRDQITSRGEYATVTSRNIFNADGKIPPALAAEETGEDDFDGPATLSKLPLSLMGTIVHANQKLSVATVNMRNKNKTEPFSIGETIDNIAKVRKIERRKITFRNLNNGRLEYIEIPKDLKLNFGFKAPQQSSDTIEKRGQFDFAVKRDEIKKYTSNLSSILNDARMVPNIIPGSGGQVSGFRFVSIKPGSVFEKLGFKPMDVIKSVNGEEVNSPTKAMEFYNALKSSNRVSLGVERGGRDETFSYSITE